MYDEGSNMLGPWQSLDIGHLSDTLVPKTNTVQLSQICESKHNPTFG